MSPINRYAPTSRFGEGFQTSYDGGLQYGGLDGGASIATPLGDLTSTLATVGGTIVGGPAGGAGANVLATAISGLFGGGAVDQARLARVNYFYGLAAAGNVAAAQLILGAPPNVSGNERPMWEAAASQLAAAAPDVYAEAQADGPLWLQNSGDTATNYPAMRRVTAAWASAHPIATATGAIGGAIADYFNPTPGPGQPASAQHGMSTQSQLILFGAVALGVYALTAKRRR